MNCVQERKGRRKSENKKMPQSHHLPTNGSLSGRKVDTQGRGKRSCAASDVVMPSFTTELFDSLFVNGYLIRF